MLEVRGALRHNQRIGSSAAQFFFFSPHRGPKYSLRILLSKVEIISANEELLVMTHICLNAKASE